MPRAVYCRHCQKAGLRLLAPRGVITETVRDDPVWDEHRAIILAGMAPINRGSIEEVKEEADRLAVCPSPWDKRWCPRCWHYCWPIGRSK